MSASEGKGILNDKEAAARIKRSRSWLAKARCGVTPVAGPPFFKMGRSVFYRQQDIDEWLEQYSSRTILSTSELPVDRGAAASLVVRRRKHRLARAAARDRHPSGNG